MKAFADLYAALDETNKTSEKVAALRRYFAAATPEPSWSPIPGPTHRRAMPTLGHRPAARRESTPAIAAW